ncbi:hypothetical protein Tco_0726816 [Tanacetum coccineum]|uniref:Uncharacterized protein n=1 Tax=Tanacetum coccineum TaxID=301880 RepID=A0ABQ4YH96_9ASTR
MVGDGQLYHQFELDKLLVERRERSFDFSNEDVGGRQLDRDHVEEGILGEGCCLEEIKAMEQGKEISPSTIITNFSDSHKPISYHIYLFTINFSDPPSSLIP